MSEEIKNPAELNEASAENNKPVTDNDEIKAFHKEVLGKPDNPLVVHKKSDASYEENSTAFEMEQTHNEEAKPTLERHRFKREPGEKHTGLKFLIVFLVVIAALFAALYFTGNLPFQQEATTVMEETTEEETTRIEDKYQGTIVVKDAYIFVDGYEVDGIEGLQSELKYKDASTKAYTIITEHAESSFLNYDVYPLLTDMGFFGDDTEVKTVEKTGLMAQEEIAEAEAATATTAAVTEAATEAAEAAETTAEETTAA